MVPMITFATDRRRLPLIRIGVLVMVGMSGCGRVDWNWDWAWWQSPRRVVQPTKPDAAVKQDLGQPAPSPTSMPSSEETAAPAGHPGDELARSRQEMRPFHQLYVSSVSAPDSGEHGEQRVRLQQAPARPCASVLEMLCIPLGRSGSAEDCYLLYEDAGEFASAVQIAAILDVQPLAKPIPTVAPGEAFNVGLGHLYSIMDRGAVVERPLIDAAEKRFAEALQSAETPMPQRWAAGVLASRLMSEYRYDYSAARSYASQAERLANSDSLEQLTAMYWRADALAQEGRSADAALVFQTIVEKYGPRVSNSQLVRQAKLGVREKRKKS